MAQQWTPPPASGAPANVPNHLVPAIISAICCFPLGIIGVVFAAQVNGKVQAGDIQGAMDASKKAKMFSYIFLGLGLAWWIFCILMWVLGVGLSIFAGNV
jgi:hypothetical protein